MRIKELGGFLKMRSWTTHRGPTPTGLVESYQGPTVSLVGGVPCVDEQFLEAAFAPVRTPATYPNLPAARFHVVLPVTPLGRVRPSPNINDKMWKKVGRRTPNFDELVWLGAAFDRPWQLPEVQIAIAKPKIKRRRR